MDILDMRIFIRVAALQNLSLVAAEFHLAPGTVSKRLQAMEKQLKARLFERTTRSIRITNEGQILLEHVERIIEELNQAYAAVGDVVQHPRGKITLSAPACLNQRYITPAVCAFMKQFPDIDVQVDLGDRIVNLQEGGYDLAIRIGELSDSTLIAKRLAPDRRLIVAAPDYLKSNDIPRVPADLGAHNCLLLNDTAQWSFMKDGEQLGVRVDGRLRSNNGEMLCQAALAGHGLLQASALQISDELQRGKLVPVLEDYAVASGAAIWAVYPSSRHILPKLRVLLDFMANWFRKPDDKISAGSGAPLDLIAATRTSARNLPARPANR